MPPLSRHDDRNTRIARTFSSALPDSSRGASLRYGNHGPFWLSATAARLLLLDQGERRDGPSQDGSGRRWTDRHASGPAETRALASTSSGVPTPKPPVPTSRYQQPLRRSQQTSYVDGGWSFVKSQTGAASPLTRLPTTVAKCGGMSPRAACSGVSPPLPSNSSIQTDRLSQPTSPLLRSDRALSVLDRGGSRARHGFRAKQCRHGTPWIEGPQSRSVHTSQRCPPGSWSSGADSPWPVYRAADYVDAALGELPAEAVDVFDLDRQLDPVASRWRRDRVGAKEIGRGSDV